MSASDDAARAERLHTRIADFPAERFQFDPRMKDGWLSDRYFVRTASTLAHAGLDPEVTLQVFAKQEGVAAGVYEGLRLLQTQLCEGYLPQQLRVRSLMDGDAVAPWETVMHVSGPYRAFAHLETPLLGVLARRTLVASNVRRAIDAAAGRPVIFMAARHDDWRVQVADGYAARVGGASSVSSDAGGSWWGARGVGTMPHAMVAAFGGDVVEATLAFARYIRAQEPEVRVVSLVDYRNDVIGDALRVARAMAREFGPGVLSAVRADTSEMLVDRALVEDPELWGRVRLTGVNEHLVRRLRAALDAEGFHDVGIVVSGGFTPAKIARFEREGVPVTAYGVGSSLLGHTSGEGLLTSFDFTADVVRLDGRAESKVGRRFQDNSRLVEVDWARMSCARAPALRMLPTTEGQRTMTGHTARVGWIVDVQNDFAKRAAPGGRLYVHDLFDASDRGAEAVEPRVVEAVRLLREHCDALVYTGDWHAMDDEEIDAIAPDATRGTYPPHCMGLSADAAEREGAEIISEIRPYAPLLLPRDATAAQAREVAERAVRERRPVFIQKHRFSVFEGNAATDDFLHALQRALRADWLEFYVLGHARDVCVTQFVDGVQRPERRDRGYGVVALRDAMAGLGLEPEAETLARWSASGAEIRTVAELREAMGDG